VISLDGLRVALDAVGFMCLPADIVNGVISLARGNWVDAGIDIVAAIPWMGDQIKAGHMVEKAGEKAIQGLEFTYKAAGNAADAVDTLKSGLKGTLDALDSMMGMQREFAVVGGLTMSMDVSGMQEKHWTDSMTPQIWLKMRETMRMALTISGMVVKL